MNDVSVRQASLLTCGICGHPIGPREKDSGHSKKDLMRCLYKANIGVVEVIQQNKWLIAEKKYGDLPRTEPKSIEKIEKDGKQDGWLYTYEDGIVITVSRSGDIIDVQRPRKEIKKVSFARASESAPKDVKSSGGTKKRSKK